MLKTMIPPPVYAISCAALMWLLDKYFPLTDLLASPWSRMGLLIIGIGVLLDIASLGLFFRSKTTPNPIKPENASKLVISGMYKFTRNPMYLGMLISLTGWWIYLGSLSPVLILPLFILILNVQQIVPEEAVLEKKFGHDYLEYKRRVRRWI